MVGCGGGLLFSVLYVDAQILDFGQRFWTLGGNFGQLGVIYLNCSSKSAVAELLRLTMEGLGRLFM